MKYFIILLVIFSFTSTVFAIDTHCSSHETIIFSCNTGKKIASVCASKNLSSSLGYMQYRFGKKGAIESKIPETTNTHPSKYTNGNTIMYSGGGGAYLRFIKGQYGYVMYGGMGRGWEKDGVAVEKNGAVILNLPCKGNVSSEIGRELFDKFGIPEDPQIFNMP